MKKTVNYLIAILLMVLAGCQGAGPVELTHAEKIKKAGYQFISQYKYHFKFGELDESSREFIFKDEYDCMGRRITNTIMTFDLSHSRSNTRWINKTYHYTYEEDPANNNLKVTTTDEGGQIIDIRISKTNDQGRVIEDITYDANGDLESRTEYFYKDTGWGVMEKKEYNSWGTLIAHKYIDPKSTPEKKIFIVTDDEETYRLYETRPDENTVRSDLFYEDPAKNFFTISRLNEFGFDIETTYYRAGDIPFLFIRNEYEKFKDQHTTSLLDDFYYLIFPKTMEEEDEKAIDNSPWFRAAIIAFIALMAIIFAITTS